MQWDCFLNPCGGSRTKFSGGMFLVLLLFINSLLRVGSLYIDCDAIKHCDCFNLEGHTSIDCPGTTNTALISQYPIQLKLSPSAQGADQAFLEIKCNTLDFLWKEVQNVDLSYDKISAKVTKLTIQGCATNASSLASLFKAINVPTTEVKRFTQTPLLDGTQLKSVPQGVLAMFPNIEILNLRGNELEEVPDLSHCPHLEELNLNNNRLKSLSGPDGGGNSSLLFNTTLKRIVIDNNPLESLPPNAFPPTLEHLQLGSKTIKTVAANALSNLKNLKRLIIQNSSLKQAPVEWLDNLTSLEQLWASGCQFSEFPTLQNLPELTNIKLNWISLEKEPLKLMDLPSLTVVDIQKSRLTQVPEAKNVPGLKSIILSWNHIQNLTRDFFSSIPNLTSIDLTGNKIVELVEIRSPLMEQLLLGENRILAVPKNAFVHLSLLKNLSLFKNQIQEINFNAFDYQENLERLDLSRNNISYSNAPFKNVKDDLGFGNIGDYSFLNKCVSLRHLNLSRNGLEKIFYDWVGVFTTLESIDLSYNRISNLAVENDLNFISNQPLWVDLSFNNISRLNFDSLYLLDTNNNDVSVDIHLDGNPLTCDCLTYYGKVYKSRTRSFHMENLFCANPPQLKGHRMFEVPNDQLLCPINESQCPSTACSCWMRPLDKSVVVNCSNHGFSDGEMPALTWPQKNLYSKWRYAIDFSKNNISKLEHRYLLGVVDKASFVDLSRNNLHSIGFLNMLKDDSVANLNFSLAHNPFTCTSCDFIIPWITFGSHIVDSDNITCVDNEIGEGGSANTLLTSYDFSTLAKGCSPSTASLSILIVAVAIFATLCIVLIVVIIRKSWVIKAFLFSKGLGWVLFWDSNMDENDEERLYDAFISYSHRDADLVEGELVQKLEGEEGFKLCIHERDWVPGDWIPDQIIRSVGQSKRTVVVLSKNFVESIWSRLEFKAAHAQALSNSTNRVILILLEDDFKDQDVQDDDLRVYMKMNTFLKWSDPWFWHKLKYALPHRKHGKDQESLVKKMEQREKARELDKLRTKLEQTV